MTQAQYLLLAGDVSEGMFPSERTVVFKDYDGNTVSVIASERLVTEESGGSFVEVMLIEHERERNRALVMLPGDVYGAGRYASVRASDLREGAAAA